MNVHDLYELLARMIQDQEVLVAVPGEDKARHITRAIAHSTMFVPIYPVHEEHRAIIIVGEQDELTKIKWGKQE